MEFIHAMDQHVRRLGIWDLKLVQCAAMCLALLWAACILAAGCSDSDQTSAPATDPAVAGVVTELHSGAAVADAGLLLIDPATLEPASLLTGTDDDGRYAIYDVASGVYHAVIFHDSLAIFDRTSGTITVTDGTTTVWDARIQPTGLWATPRYRIEGVVRDAATNAPLSNAYVTTFFSSSFDVSALILGVGGPWLAVTDSEGRFSLEALEAVDPCGQDLGLAPVTITRAGYESTTLAGDRDAGIEIGFLPLPAEGDSVLTVEAHLRRRTPASPRGALRGRVTFLGSPVPGVPVALSLDHVSDPDTLTFTHTVCSPVAGQTVATDGSGRFLFTDLTPGRYTVHAAYLYDDGFCGFGVGPQAEEVTDGDTLDVGAMAVFRDILCEAPVDGSVGESQRPTFRWRALPDTLGHELLDYALEIAIDDYIPRTHVNTRQEAEWTLSPDSAFAPGTCVKWWVEARALHTATGDTVLIGSTERFYTFQVAE